MDVDWGGAIVVKDKQVENKNSKESRLWTSLLRPKKVSDIIGNSSQIEEITKWFLNRQLGLRSKCLLIHGPSGVGKSSIVDLIARQNGFNLVHTHSDIQRTCQKMNNLFKKVSIIGKSGILVLDDAETFIQETSGTRYLSKILRSVDYIDYGIIIIVNEIDSSLENIRDISTVIKFNKLSQSETYKLFRRMTTKVSEYSYIPPMASYFISGGSVGNILQSVNQLQLLYQDTNKPILNKNKRKRTICTLDKPQVKSKKDCGIHMWSNMYRRSSIDHILAENDVTDTIMNMSKDFLGNLGNNVYREYINYFGNGSISSLEDIDRCISHISISDTNRPEAHDDRLYHGENSSRWVEDDLNYVIHTIGSLNILKGRKKYPEMTNTVKKNKRKFI